MTARGASRTWFVLGSLLVGCGNESESPANRDAETTTSATFDALVQAAPDAAPVAQPWTFAVLSDLHLPNPRARDVTQVVAALIELHVRAVVITGDHTNGNFGDRPRTPAAAGWQSVAAAMTPLREAGIAVLPVAGNHDSYEAWQRDQYASTFGDIDAWAAPFAVSPSTGHGEGRAPFSYSVDIDGVHLSLVHVVAQVVEPAVAAWLASDLQAAAGAKHRIVFTHVPLSSVIWASKKSFLDQFGALLERGRVTLHVAGHEHIVWDEDVSLPSGAALHQVIVGCSSGFYQYAPNSAAKLRAHCTPIADPSRREPMRCVMPHGGGMFEIARGRKNRHVQHARTTFVLFTVNGDSIDVRPMTLDAAGHASPFYLDQAR